MGLFFSDVDLCPIKLRIQSDEVTAKRNSQREKIWIICQKNCYATVGCEPKNEQISSAELTTLKIESNTVYYIVS